MKSTQMKNSRFNPKNWRLFSELVADVKIRSPYYWSDWKDAWNYRVIPSTLFMFFANLLPAIAFAQDAFDRTESAYGVNEVLMGSALGSIAFGLFGGQPLIIVGVTGPVTIFTYTVFEIVHPRGIPFFPFMSWICIWSFVLHTLITMVNGVRYFKYVSLFSCDIFATFINIVYIQKGIQLLSRQFHVGQDTIAGIGGAYFSIVTALCVCIFGTVFYTIGNHSKFFNKIIRKFIADYSMPLLVVFFTGFTFFPGRISDLDILRLPTGNAFIPTTNMFDRGFGWFIHFWNIKVQHVFLALPFATLLTALFYFDHNISSVMSQGPSYQFKKPSAFHWDYFLLGITTLVAGVFGVLPPNGLIPQAPLHTQSLATSEPSRQRPAKVVEQRATNVLQGILTLAIMSGPLLKVLGLIPQGVLAGLFFCMGVPGLFDAPVIQRLYLIFTDTKHRKSGEKLYKVRDKSLLIYMSISIIGVVGEVVMTGTIAAIGFPAVLFVFLAIGKFLNRFIPENDLAILDGLAASQFVMDALDRRGKSPLEESTEEPLESPCCSSEVSCIDNAVEEVANDDTCEILPKYCLDGQCTPPPSYGSLESCKVLRGFTSGRACLIIDNKCLIINST